MGVGVDGEDVKYLICLSFFYSGRFWFELGCF